jgi:hypothetical protein
VRIAMARGETDERTPLMRSVIDVSNVRRTSCGRATPWYALATLAASISVGMAASAGGATGYLLATDNETPA